MAYLLDNCPVLASVDDELLRLVNAPIGTRLVVSETSLGGKKLRPGKKILMPYRQLHMDTQIFGPDTNKFKSERFLQDKNLIRNTSYRPFGGGNTYCPGRFMSRREICMFVALLLHRFDARLHEGNGEKPPFPRMDFKIPASGMFGSVPRDDVVVEVAPLEIKSSDELRR